MTDDHAVGLILRNHRQHSDVVSNLPIQKNEEPFVMCADSMLDWDRFHLVNKIRRPILFGMILLIGVRSVIAGPVPMPAEAHLDLAKSVVVGQITQITPLDVQIAQGVHYGRATIVVKEMLKGSSDTTIKAIVATSYGPEFNQGAANEPEHPHKVGDSGIWLLSPIAEGLFAGTAEDFFPEQRKADIQRMLKELAQRKWSEPVNGLRASAMVVPLEDSANCVIIFAVNNATNKDLYIPVEWSPGLVQVSAKNEQGNVFNFVLRLPDAADSGKLYCSKLSPGQIAYLHPDYSYIDLARRQNLAPGKYSVVVSCKNERTAGEASGIRPGASVPITAWKGECSAPAVDLSIVPDVKQDPQQLVLPDDHRDMANPKPPASPQEALKLAWKQVQAIQHPLLKDVGRQEPQFDFDDHGFHSARIEFICNAEWVAKNAEGKKIVGKPGPSPTPIDPHQPFVWITVSLGRSDTLSQPTIKTVGLTVDGVEYSLLVTVASSDTALAKRVETILNNAFTCWRPPHGTESPPAQGTMPPLKAKRS